MPDVTTDSEVSRQAARRRTFAIISHPDAGKTTLTEKLLLYGGQMDVAGSVRGRKTQRAATSDWMELEKQRGISVTSTALTFDYEGYRVNLLDTPGHHDFSEDTYRTLMAADCAVMVIDLAKGVETQTEKLFRVCALRKIPIITFVNKVDRPGQEPLGILANLEEKLGIEAIPYNWPVGTGQDFRGVVDRDSGVAHLFERGTGQLRLKFDSVPLAQLAQTDIDERVREQTLEEWELVNDVGSKFDLEHFLAGRMTPVFFGSALNNYGVEHFMRGFLNLCPAPHARETDVGPMPVDSPLFSGFIFKIQANLDPKHRDRVAFLRVCSGKFMREMEVTHPRTGKKLRLPRAHRLFAQDRETMEEAFPGDIIGLANPGEFQLGDTLCEGKTFNYEPLPQFPPEFFATLRCMDTARRKQFGRGMEQLIDEGAIQFFTRPDAMRRDPILAAVGELQLDVVRFRLQTEYNTETSIEWLPYVMARWISGEPEELSKLHLPYTAARVIDRLGQPAVLFHSKWDAEYTIKKHPAIKFSDVSGRGFNIVAATAPPPAW